MGLVGPGSIGSTLLDQLRDQVNASPYLLVSPHTKYENTFYPFCITLIYNPEANLISRQYL